MDIENTDNICIDKMLLDLDKGGIISKWYMHLSRKLITGYNLYNDIYIIVRLWYTIKI